MLDNLCYIHWSVNPDIYLGDTSIHLYSLMFALGLLAGGLVVIRLLRGYNISQSYIIYAFVGMLLGARLFHVFFEWHQDGFFHCPQKNVPDHGAGQ